MSRNLFQVYTDNPAAALGGNDLFYLARSPYGITNDMGVQWSVIQSYFAPAAGSGSITTLGTVTTGTWNATIISPTYGGTGVNNGASTLTLGGNTTFSGAFTTTFAVTGNTSLTLPQTGTLVSNTVTSLPNLAVVGTITTGVWNATPIDVTHGGTGLTGTTINQLLYSSANNVLAGLATANNGVLVTSAGGVPSIGGTLPSAVQGNITTTGTITSGTWNATAIPVQYGGTGQNFSAITTGNVLAFSNTGVLSTTGVGTTGALLQSAGGGGVPTFTTATYPSTTTASQILYSSTANTVTGLATANNGILATNGSGVPSITSTLPSAVQGNITTLGTIVTGVWNATAIGVIYGGTGLTSTTINQILYSSANNTIAGLATGNSGVLITSGGGVPSISSTVPSGLTIPSPKITTGIYDTNGNLILALNPVASAVNYIAIANSISGAGVVTMNPGGSDTNILFSIGGVGVSGVQIQGVSGGGNKSAGYVGEVISSTIAFASAVSLANNTAKNVTSISLTAGDWDVFSNVNFAFSGLSTYAIGWSSNTTATLPDSSLYNAATYVSATGQTPGFSAPYRRVSISATTTVYLSAQAGFTTGTGTVCGAIYARRC